MLAGLTNGEWDHDSCEATVSTKGADHATIMREQLMGYRKQRFAALFCAAAVIMLGGCGDDLTQQVYIPGREDLAQPIGGYHSGTQSGQTQESSTASPQTSTASGEADMPVPGMSESSTALASDRYTITISAAGDVTLGNHQEQDYSASFRQAYDQAEDEGYFFENVRDIFAADDMTIVNLEGPLTTSEQMREGQTYCIKGDPAYAHLLTLGSIEAVSFANNHRLDYGEQGSRDTVVALEQEGIIYAYDKNVGIYEIPDSAAAHGGERNLKIGIISVNEVEWGAQAEKLIQNNIETLREQDVDLILACCHWGIEKDNYPENYQQVLGRKCIDWGADLVLGHHPHVLQGIDQYHGKYIVYSLANFCFGANRNPADKDTMIFQQTFSFRKGEDDGFLEAEPGEARVIPCSVSSVSTRNDFRPTPLSGEEGERVIGRINEYSREFGVTVDKDGVVSYAGQLSALE